MEAGEAAEASEKVKEAEAKEAEEGRASQGQPGPAETVEAEAEVAAVEVALVLAKAEAEKAAVGEAAERVMEREGVAQAVGVDQEPERATCQGETDAEAVVEEVAEEAWARETAAEVTEGMEGLASKAPSGPEETGGAGEEAGEVGGASEMATAGAAKEETEDPASKARPGLEGTGAGVEEEEEEAAASAMGMVAVAMVGTAGRETVG